MRNQNAEKEAIQKIHENTLRLLAEVGIAFHDDTSLETLARGGVKVADGRAYFNETQVMDTLKQAGKSFTLYARNPIYDVHMDTESLHITPGFGSAMISDLSGALRASSLDDFINLSDLVTVSEAFKINGGILAQPCELPGNIAALAMLYTLLKRSDKALLGISADGKTTGDIFGMLKIVFPDFPRKQRILTMISPMSPLSIDKNAAETLRACAEHNQPVIIAPGPMAGGTGPISLAGNISVANAEILGVNVLAQMISPGLPVVYGFAATTSDMRNMSVSNASPGFLKQARFGAMMAKHYGLPCRSGGGMSDAGGLTAQAGVESALGLFESFSEGANLVMHATGSLHSFNSICYEKFIMDTETIDRLRYYFDDLPVDEEALAFDAVLEVIESGSQFMTSDHTLERCRTDPWQPIVSLHGRAGGEPNTELYASISKKMEEMLRAYRRPKIDPAAEAALDKYAEEHGITEETIQKASRGS